jgi:hypothetical protein|tara:strand:- start:147 stop:428 length:282 start_codon:yes stop_codon:yes gene_type:complete
MGIFNWLKNLFSSPSPVVPTPAPAPAPVSKPAPKKAEPKKAVAKAEPKMTKASLSKLTKSQIEEKGREFGIEVDKRQKKDKLISEVLAASKKA